MCKSVGYKGLLCTDGAGQMHTTQGVYFYPSPNYPTMEHIYQSHCDIKYTVLDLQVEIDDMFAVQYLEYSGNICMCIVGPVSINLQRIYMPLP